MQEKHQWMSHTLFDMAAFCDRNGMDKQRDVLLDAAAALTGSMSMDPFLVEVHSDSHVFGAEVLREHLARAHAA